MRQSIQKEFGEVRPRALVLDDDRRARTLTARRLRYRRFDVVECATVEEFRLAWKPGLFDVIVADWDLSAEENESGDRVLEEVRRKDWDVPFVLVSGKLDQDATRVDVLERLLINSNARFVTRGANGIAAACEAAESLIERRDLALLKTILSLRPAALAGAVVPVTSGAKRVSDILADIVSTPRRSHDAEYGVVLSLMRKNAPQK